MYVITDELYRELEKQTENLEYHYEERENEFPIPVLTKSFFYEARHIDIKDIEELGKAVDWYKKCKLFVSNKVIDGRSEL